MVGATREDASMAEQEQRHDETRGLDGDRKRSHHAVPSSSPGMGAGGRVTRHSVLRPSHGCDADYACSPRQLALARDRYGRTHPVVSVIDPVPRCGGPVVDSERAGMETSECEHQCVAAGFIRLDPVMCGLI